MITTICVFNCDSCGECTKFLSTEYAEKAGWQLLDNDNCKCPSCVFFKKRMEFYAKRRELAEMVAYRERGKLEQNAKYKEISLELRKLNYVLAYSLVKESENVPSLKERRKLLYAERKRIFQSLNINPAHLKPRYQCKKCSDTGFKQDGTLCDCFYEEQD